ncbi:MAG: hypothetical protein ACPKPY_01055 [Nitrososphaeraceae archaeon]
MKISALACRIYKINPVLNIEIKKLFNHSDVKNPLYYDTIGSGKDQLKLYIEIQNMMDNDYGQEIQLRIDHYTRLKDRENPDQIVRFYKDYQIQLIENKRHFKDCVIIFGPKEIDSSIIKAIKNSIQKDGEKLQDPFIQIRIDINSKIDKFTKEFPNLQHFCISNIPDDKMKRVVVRGQNLEETDLFERFVVDKTTSGPINFLGIVTEFGKVIYIGSDGSIYSRMGFEKEDVVKIIYNLLEKLKKIDVIIRPIEDYL